MSVYFIEDSESRSATISRKGLKAESTLTKSWKAFGTSDDSELHREINSQIPTTWQYPDQNATLKVDSYTVSYLGDEAWQVTANYKKNGIEDDANRGPFQRSRSFDTGGGTAHKTQAFSETVFGSGPSMNNAIGVTSDRVEGVDIVAPSLQWSEDYEVPDSYVTAAYIKQVAQLTGCVNNAQFKSFAAGEVLFVGCTGSQERDEDRGNGPWKLSYKFVAAPNAGPGQTYDAITVGSMSVTKKGHEYMWVLYESDADSSTKTLLKKPKYVYVNRVYREQSFSGLGIGS